MKKQKAKFLIIPCTIFLFLLVSYIGLAFYYQNGFLCGTWINGVYCTGRSVDEAESLLLQTFHQEDLYITGRDNQSDVLNVEKYVAEVDYHSQLLSYLENQKPFLWILNFTLTRNHELQPEIEYQTQDLNEAIENLSFFQRKPVKADVWIEKTEQGYQLFDTTKDVLDTEKAKTAVVQAVFTGESNLSLEGEEFFEEITLTKDMMETKELWEKVNNFQQCGIVYDMGDTQIPLTPDITCEFISLNEDGSFLLDENKNLVLSEEGIEAFLENLAKEFDTYDTVRSFTTSLGDIVSVDGGNYGNLLDQKAEKEYLTEAFLEKKTELHVPEYKQKALYQGKDDIGLTYIEIDLSNQTLYYYQDGELYLETLVVTGDMRRKRSTPERTCFVYGKQKNRVLRGPGYASPVKFWIPIYGNIGIHDSSWRKEFGEDIYMTNGSHGCINTPIDNVEKLYDAVEVGTPVIMYYRDEK